MKKVGLIMGSKNDFPVVENSLKVLKEFGVEYEVKVSSAHRTPEATGEWVKGAKGRGIGCIIAFAGAAAHLAGVVASETNLPVLAVPVDATALQGVDALYSMVQMPGGIPVATMAIGNAGAKNAAIFACQMVGVENDKMAQKLEDYRANMRDKVYADDAALQEELKNS